MNNVQMMIEGGSDRAWRVLPQAFSITSPIRGWGHVKGSTPRHAQAAGDLGFLGVGEKGQLWMM